MRPRTASADRAEFGRHEHARRFYCAICHAALVHGYTEDGTAYAPRLMDLLLRP